MENSSEQKNTVGAEVQAHQADDGTFELVMSDTGRMAAATAKSEEGSSAAQATRTPSGRSRFKPVGFLLLAAGLLLVAILVYAFSGDEGDSADAVAQASASSDGFKPYREGPAGAAAPMAPRREENRADRAPEDTPNPPAFEGRPLVDPQPDNQEEVSEQMHEDLQQMRQQEAWQIEETGDYEEMRVDEVGGDEVQDDRVIEAEEEEEVLTDEELAAEQDDEEPLEDDEQLIPEEELDEPVEYDAKEIPAAETNSPRRLIRAPRLERRPSRRLDRIKLRRFANDEPTAAQPPNVDRNVEGGFDEAEEGADEYYEGEDESLESGDDRIPGFGRD